MPTPLNTGTRDIPLKFAKRLTAIVNGQFDLSSEEFLGKFTPVTRDLLRFWFDEAYSENRTINFHQGQKQAILNAIYVHEVLKSKTVFSMYESVDDCVLAEMDKVELAKTKYQYPKYAMKMATGTGKTWVMHALLLWQYLNAKHEQGYSGRYSKNFLLVAPGLIVYERLLDAYLGKENAEQTRQFETSDFKKYESLFIPPWYTEEIFGFIQSSVCRKDEIGRKVTGDGLIAITNWHLLVTEDDASPASASPLEDPSKTVRDLLPIRPGISTGHALESLDGKHFHGNELEYLRNLNDLVTINDEAHHIHENKTYGEIEEVEWQQSLNYISAPKGDKFIQIDFSATPYDVTGSGQNRQKHYFPHIVVDFDLRTAIHLGLVKTIILDKRKELATLPLDFKAERDNGKISGLSDGQKTMLRAGIAKLRLLEEHFIKITADKGTSEKYPKMFVICENTEVTPLVAEYLMKYEGLTDEDIAQIDSNKKGEIPEDAWTALKQRLFNADKHSKPKVIVSVLMLREGFDVSNICVIVPLRSSQAPILLEQTIGRGLRLMWREPEYREIKDENREALLTKKKEPTNYLDLLSIIEHPAFIQFYDDLLKEVPTVDTDLGSGGVTGDIISVGLKSNYKEYDLYFPIVHADKEELLVLTSVSIDKMEPFSAYPLERLQGMLQKMPSDDVFYSEEMTVKTRFGDYVVRCDLFSSKSYNEYLSKIVNAVSTMLVKTSSRKTKSFPVMQINQVEITRAIDIFLRTRLFGKPFDPFEGTNWRVLLLQQTGIVEHIVREVSRAIYDLQNSFNVSEATVIKRWFSEVPTLRMRENYCLNITKTIYEKQSYPSNKGGFEKDFMLFCDRDSQSKALIKINENYHDFARITYVRADGMLAQYSPDFIVKTSDKMYIVETKGADRLSTDNVKLKQIATLDWVARINKLNPDQRINVTWEYALIDDITFYAMSNKGAGLIDILNYVTLTRSSVQGTLF